MSSSYFKDLVVSWLFPLGQSLGFFLSIFCLIEEPVAILPCYFVPESEIPVFPISSLIMLPLVQYLMSQAVFQCIILLGLRQHAEHIDNLSEVQALPPGACSLVEDVVVTSTWLYHIVG